MSTTVPALVLDDAFQATSSEAVHFANFPGLWFDGRPIAVSELGFADADEAHAAVVDAGLPLVATTVAEGEGAMPPVENKLPGDLEARATGWKPSKGQPGYDLGPGEEFPPALGRPDELQLAELALLDQNAPDAIAALEAYDGPAHVFDALRTAEVAGKNRTTVLAAIDARLAGPAGDVEPDETEETG